MGIFRYSTLIFICIFGSGLSMLAQEFNARVTVDHSQVQSSNVQIFRTLETSLFEFINNTKWTGDTYDMDERIEANFAIVIRQMPSMNQFSGMIQVNYARPVFNTSYLSPILNHQDPDFTFQYVEFDRLEYNDNTSNPNLVAIIAFYIYVILGMDADSFEKGSGAKYYQNALKIANFMQSDGRNPGWRDGEGIGQNNRYWIAENLNNPINEPLADILYDYHRNGLDLMYDKGNHKKAKENIIAALLKVEQLHTARPTGIIPQMFLNAKRNEILRIFGDGEPVNTVPLRTMLEKVDPTNRNKYEDLGTSR
ncbi:MAG: DUF4835 family protein [Flavobacteriales bacterium]|nr:MAG: DUF4835 family protein [Flavobacteriales bacterium]